MASHAALIERGHALLSIEQELLRHIYGDSLLNILFYILFLLLWPASLRL